MDKGQHQESKNWRNRYYREHLENLIHFLIPEGESVLELGFKSGSLLEKIKPKRALGIDTNPEKVVRAQKEYPEFEFRAVNSLRVESKEKFDSIILSDTVGSVPDVEDVFHDLKQVSHKRTRIVITYFNYAWEPFLLLAEKIHLKAKQPRQHWLAEKDIENLLYLAGFEVVKRGKKMLVPFYIPLVSAFMNRIVANLPFINRFCLIQYFVARPIVNELSSHSVSVVIPARNEKGNIEEAVRRLPKFGSSIEIIFVEGHSKDGTLEEIKRVITKYQNTHDIKVFEQKAKGKGDAVRLGFGAATGDILMILDADLSVPPEEMPKFYNVLSSGRAEFINGSRLIYPMEKEAMRFLNVLGNKFFSLMFTWLLGQRIKDTLCGTKVLFKEDYEKIVKGRAYFGDFDPFGDFDLLFGAAKLNLKIVELPVHYKARRYGVTQIQRWKHGWLLLKMCIFAAHKLK